MKPYHDLPEGMSPDEANEIADAALDEVQRDLGLLKNRSADLRSAYRAGYSAGHADGSAGNPVADEERCDQFFGKGATI